MRAKLTAAAVVLAAFGLTGGAVWLSKAEAQPGPGGVPPGAGNNKPEREAGAPGRLVGPPGVGGVAAGPSASPSGGRPGMGGFGGVGFAPTTWEYKFVDVKGNRQEFESVITQHGKAGWEFCSSERFASDNKAEVVLVFKRAKGSGGFGGMGMSSGMPGMPGGVGGASGKGGSAGGVGGAGAMMSSGGAGGEGLWGNWGGHNGVEVRSFTLHSANAKEVAAGLTKALPGAVRAAVPEPQANRLLVVADAAAMKDVSRVVGDLDAKAGKAGAGDPLGAGGPMGGSNPGGYPRMMGPGGAGPSGYSAPGGKKPEGNYNVFNLKNANAADMEVLMKKLFPGTDMAADPRTNALIVRADQDTLEKMAMLITRLDTDSGKGK